ncbi:MAG: LysR family transcriptional regulator [Tateyamaria sp.]
MLPHWDDLRLFLAVGRAETLSAAAKAVRKDAATLGRRIARLERDLDTTLFRKSPQGYALTEAGARLMAQAEAAEEAISRVAATRAAGDEADAELTGQIRVGAPDGCANYVLPQVCARIAHAHPQLDLQIVALPRVFNLSRREADLAIGVSAPTAGQLVVQRITDYRLHFAASDTYLADAPELTDLSDLRAHRVIGYIPDMIFDQELDYLADAGVARVALASNSVAVQLNLLQQDAGVGVVHDFALAFAPSLRRVLQSRMSLTRSFFLIRHASDRSDRRLNKIADLVARGVRAEVARLEGVVSER